MAEIEYMMHPLPSVFLMELDIPTEFVESCNDYLDELVTQDDKVSAAHTLVGQIKTGELRAPFFMWLTSGESLKLV